jgi:hypothetical protein
MELYGDYIDAYKGTIPGGVVVTPVVEYYIVAGDGVNVASHPEVNHKVLPISVEVNLSPSKVTLAEPSPGDMKAESVLLTWSECPDDDVAVYGVYVSEVSGSKGDWAMNVTGRSQTTAEVTGFSPDTEYFFTVRVYDEGGLTSYSDQLAVKTKPRSNMLPALGC